MYLASYLMVCRKKIGDEVTLVVSVAMMQKRLVIDE